MGGHRQLPKPDRCCNPSPRKNEKFCPSYTLMKTCRDHGGRHNCSILWLQYIHANDSSKWVRKTKATHFPVLIRSDIPKAFL